MITLQNMERFCLVCEKLHPSHTTTCCSPDCLVATRERGLFIRRREYFSLDGTLLTDSHLKDMIAHKKAEANSIKREEEKRAAETMLRNEISDLKRSGVRALERFLRHTKRDRRLSAYAGHNIEDEVFEVQDAARRRAAISALGDIHTPEALVALRNVMADQSDNGGRVYSPSREMKIDELKLIASIIERYRDKNAIVIECPNCNSEHDISSGMAGQYITCHNCSHRMLAPIDRTPEAWLERHLKASNWDAILEPFSYPTYEESKIDPWGSKKYRLAWSALVTAGKDVIPFIVKQLIRSKGKCIHADSMYHIISEIGDPSGAPYLKSIGQSLTGQGIQNKERGLRLVEKYGDSPCDSELLSQLETALGLTSSGDNRGNAANTLTDGQILQQAVTKLYEFKTLKLAAEILRTSHNPSFVSLAAEADSIAGSAATLDDMLQRQEQFRYKLESLLRCGEFVRDGRGQYK